MSRKDWKTYFMEIAFKVAERSTCLKRKVGAIAVDWEGKRILATGYNGAVMGAMHCSELGCLRQNISSGKHFEICRAVHAEANLICQAAMYGISLKGSVVFCTLMPCYWCLKQLINTGIKKVYYCEDYVEDNLIKELLEQNLIEVEKVKV